MADTKKEQTFAKILNTAIALDFQRGHKKWTMSELSRKSGVTRSLIYYYFGKTPSEILKTAVKIIGEEAFGFTEAEKALWEKKQIAESILVTRKTLEHFPHLLGFYIVHRALPGDIGDSLRSMERRYIRRLKEFFPGKPEHALRGLFGVFFGFTIAPEITEESVKTGVDAALRLLDKMKPA